MPSSSKGLRALALLALAAGALASSEGAAHATPTFPSVIRTQLSAKKEPECAVCHVGGKTGIGTVNTKFGTAMRARGLTANSESSLKAALTKMADEKVDSNGDGVLDVDALKNGDDPNVAQAGASTGGPPVETDTPTYGCGGSVAARKLHGQEAALSGLAVLAVLGALRFRKPRFRRKPGR